MHAGFFDASPRGATSSDEEQEAESERDAPPSGAPAAPFSPASEASFANLVESQQDAEAKAFLQAALAEVVEEQPGDPYAALAEKCRAKAFLAGIAPPTPEPEPQPEPQPAPQPAPQPVKADEIDSVMEAVRILKKYEDVDALGAKRIVLEVKAKFPELERNGIKVGAKEVRTAIRDLAVVGLDTPPEQKKRVVTPPPVPPEIEAEVQLLATDGEANVYAGSPRGGPPGSESLFAPTGLAGEVVEIAAPAPKTGVEFLQQRKVGRVESPAAFSEEEGMDMPIEDELEQFATARKEFSALPPKQVEPVVAAAAEESEEEEELSQPNFDQAAADGGDDDRVEVMARSSDGEFLSGSPRGDVGARNLFAPTGLAGHVRQHSIDDAADDVEVAGARGDSHGLVFIEHFGKKDTVEAQVRRRVCSLRSRCRSARFLSAAAVSTVMIIVYLFIEHPRSLARSFMNSFLDSDVVCCVVVCRCRASATSSGRLTRSAQRCAPLAQAGSRNLR